MPGIISKSPLFDLSENKDLEKSVLDIFSGDSKSQVFKYYGYSSNPFKRPEEWQDTSEYKNKFGTNLFVNNVFEKDFLKKFLEAITENKYFLIRGPTGIGKSTIIALIHSLLSTSETFSNNIKVLKRA